MTSRLTACAAIFAVLATAGIAFAADAQQAAGGRRASSETMPVLILPRVEVTGHRRLAH